MKFLRVERNPVAIFLPRFIEKSLLNIALLGLGCRERKTTSAGL
ncbi:hypothetical protein BRCON_2455 [Candidatus Sumerlaea chitinivorans]|uniref:Uncharacterized protein n=1 Tax=Sumerlaea chitinivorans TaxID=2250252 RepID=A0A2Z4YA00_SUMC1|nr:hypothetical protein BRCON_2455 [Candidatus Sumerlaea chitinivorans]